MSVSKKGMEMSINIVVGIILGIAMLSAGIFLFSKIMINVDDTNKQVDEQTKKMIEEALDTGDPIYVPVSNVEVKKNSAYFWVGIRNIGSESGEFNIYVSPQPLAGNPLTFEQSRIAFLTDAYTINAKENQIVYVAVNMKGITTPITLVVKVTKLDEVTGYYVDYAKPKIVTIQP